MIKKNIAIALLAIALFGGANTEGLLLRLSNRKTSIVRGVGGFVPLPFCHGLLQSNQSITRLLRTSKRVDQTRISLGGGGLRLSNP
jgi:hypothetical protein